MAAKTRRVELEVLFTRFWVVSENAATSAAPVAAKTAPGAGKNTRTPLEHTLWNANRFPAKGVFTLTVGKDAVAEVLAAGLGEVVGMYLVLNEAGRAAAPRR